MLTWIKTHPAQTALAALSLSLAVSSVRLYQEYSMFPVAVSVQPVSPPTKPQVADLDYTPLDSALAATTAPERWQAKPNSGRLFAGKGYVVVDGKLQKPKGKMFNPPVPNDTLTAYGLDPLDPNVLEDDPDKDGFSTLLEWKGKDAISHLQMDGTLARDSSGAEYPDDSTNPVDASSHPPYHTRLAVERVEQIPFHLRFLEHDVNPRDRSEVTVQINSNPGRTEFVPVGNAFKFAPFEVRSFTEKFAPGRDGTRKDVSEVVILDRRTKQEVTLVKGELVNSPESYTILRYDWAKPGAAPQEKQRFRLRRGETFRLPPDNIEYRVTKIGTADVEIAAPDGETWIVAGAKP